jgi:hypothetical protein
MKDSLTYNFSLQEEKEIKDFCKLNELDCDKFIKDCFDKGYQIEKYGLLTINGQTVIEKEVIKEIPIEVVKTVEVIKEVIVEKPVEVIKEIISEIPVEKIVEKEVYLTDDTKINELIKKIKKLENKPPKIIEKEVEVIKEIEVVKEVENKEKQKKLQETIRELREEMRKKDETILQLEKNVVELQNIKGPIKAQYMRSSNLNDNLYR